MQYTLNLKRRNNMEWLTIIIKRLENKLENTDCDVFANRLTNMINKANMVYERTNGTYFVR
jgi:hypothetical protein